MLSITQNEFPEYTLPKHNSSLHSAIDTDQPLDLWDEMSEALHEFGRCELNDKAATRYQLQKSTIEFYSALVANPLYQSALSRNQALPDDEITRTEVSHDDLMRVDILSVSGNNPTPLHDYPGQSGILMCIGGSATITQYDHTSSPISQAYPIAKLNRIHSVTLAYGDAIPMDPTWGNILDIQSVSSRSILLSIRYRCQLNTGSHWYFPITPKRPDQCSFFAQRIHRSNAQY